MLFAAACASPSDGEDVLIVFAAASLTKPFGEIAEEFEAVNDVEVVFSFAGSSALRVQIIEGAPAEVYASANLANMEAVVDAGITHTDPVVFVANTMEIGVAPGNPRGIAGLGSLSDGDLLVGLCDATVPCGSLARRVLGGAGVVPAVDTNEPNARALVTKLEEGDLDVGMVYRSDVVGSDLINGIEIAAQDNVLAAYPVAALTASGTAAAFVAFLQSDEAGAILRRHGFATP